MVQSFLDLTIFLSIAPATVLRKKETCWPRDQLISLPIEQWHFCAEKHIRYWRYKSHLQDSDVSLHSQPRLQKPIQDFSRGETIFCLNKWFGPSEKAGMWCPFGYKQSGHSKREVSFESEDIKTTQNTDLSKQEIKLIHIFNLWSYQIERICKCRSTVWNRINKKHLIPVIVLSTYHQVYHILIFSHT